MIYLTDARGLFPTMNMYSEWLFFVCLAALFAIASSPVFRLADEPPADQPNRILALDGLRGILALAVYFHHATIIDAFLTTGSWELPPSRFYALLGQVGVSFFFMITGYLFWSRLVQQRGQPDWIKLYIGRMFRIGPLYLFVIGIMFVIVAFRSGFVLSVPLGTLAKQLSRWLMLGVFSGDINGIQADFILAGVTWTLSYEWGFYVSMPVLALAARYRRLQLPFTIAALIGSLALLVATDKRVAAGMALFAAGMVCSSAGKLSLRGARRNQAASALILVLLTFVFTTANTSYSAAVIICLGVSFYLVSVGCSMFGLLNTRAARRLGDVSYGIYLLQGLVLTLVVMPALLSFGALTNPVLYWAIVLVGAVVLITVAMLTHVLIERPGIKLGRAVTAKLRPRHVVEARAAIPVITQATK